MRLGVEWSGERTPHMPGWSGEDGNRGGAQRRHAVSPDPRLYHPAGTDVGPRGASGPRTESSVDSTSQEEASGRTGQMRTFRSQETLQRIAEGSGGASEGDWDRRQQRVPGTSSLEQLRTNQQDSTYGSHPNLSRSRTPVYDHGGLGEPLRAQRTDFATVAQRGYYFHQAVRGFSNQEQEARGTARGHDTSHYNSQQLFPLQSPAPATQSEMLTARSLESVHRSHASWSPAITRPVTSAVPPAVTPAITQAITPAVSQSASPASAPRVSPGDIGVRTQGQPSLSSRGSEDYSDGRLSSGRRIIPTAISTTSDNSGDSRVSVQSVLISRDGPQKTRSGTWVSQLDKRFDIQTSSDREYGGNMTSHESRSDGSRYTDASISYAKLASEVTSSQSAVRSSRSSPNTFAANVNVKEQRQLETGISQTAPVAPGTKGAQQITSRVRGGGRTRRRENVLQLLGSSVDDSELWRETQPATDENRSSESPVGPSGAGMVKSAAAAANVHSPDSAHRTSPDQPEVSPPPLRNVETRRSSSSPEQPWRNEVHSPSDLPPPYRRKDPLNGRITPSPPPPPPPRPKEPPPSPPPPPPSRPPPPPYRAVSPRVTGSVKDKVAKLNSSSLDGSTSATVSVPTSGGFAQVSRDGVRNRISVSPDGR